MITIINTIAFFIMNNWTFVTYKISWLLILLLFSLFKDTNNGHTIKQTVCKEECRPIVTVQQNSAKLVNEKPGPKLPVLNGTPDSDLEGMNNIKVGYFYRRNMCGIP